MKKVLLIISFVLSANFMFAQTTIEVSFPDIDVSTLNAGDEVQIPIIVDNISNLLTGFQISVRTEDTYLSWNGTNTNPGPGVAAIHPNLTPVGPDWLWNNNFANELAFSWVDPTWVGATINAGDTLLVLSYTYQGGLTGTSVIGWGQDKSINPEGTQYVKIVTEFYDEFFGIYVPTFHDGSIYYIINTTATWTGAVDSDWFNAGNWNPAVVPADGTDIDIPAVKASMPTIAGGNVITGTLNVAAGATLTLGPTGTLTTNGLFTNDGFFLITSDMTGAAGSFIDNGGLAGAGNYEFDRYMASAAVASNNGWHLVSSPVNNAVSGDFATYWLNAWDETSNYYTAVDPMADPCTGTSYGNIALNVMQGYAVKRNVDYLTNCGGCPYFVPDLLTADMIAFGGDAYGNYNPNLVGVVPGWHWVNSATDPALMSNVNTGNYSMNVTASNAGPDPTLDNYNLLGNPYSAPLDNAALVASFPAGVNQAVYVWDDANLTYQSYSGGVGIAQTPATQGFFVNATSNATVTVTNAMRTHTGAGSYYKSDVEDLVVLTATGNGFTDRTYIRFLDEAQSSFDSKWDAYKLLSTADGVPQIYTTQGNVKYSINTQPAVDLVPMSFTSNASGTYTIEAVETSDFANVVLEDLVTGIETDLLSDSYTFEYTEGENPNRFIVHFTPLGTPELEANSVHIWANDAKIFVTIPEAVTGTVAVYNMMGQEVMNGNVVSGKNVIPVNDINTYYVVKVMTGNNVKTEKVFIK